MNVKLISAVALAISVLSQGQPLPRPVRCRTLSVKAHILRYQREPGNPHSRLCDCIMWSKWRQRGGWDPTLDTACFHNPAFVPGECGLDPRSRQSVSLVIPSPRLTGGIIRNAAADKDHPWEM